ncbi:MAG: hypothetical protein BWZ09_02652 [Alphaproteobacteria bacterium ADurb.BinA305]|nr:MAG: hypothetical protein BWZ09_02652 [Alphaproteobacteria bacterium ADurb.BinA305]
MAAEKPRVVYVVECDVCRDPLDVQNLRRDAEYTIRHNWPHHACGGRFVVTKYIEAPKARRAKG